MLRRFVNGLLWCSLVWAQDIPYLIHPGKVEFVEGNPGGAIVNTVYCDSHSDLYLRYFNPGRATSAPVVRITHDGHASVFPLGQISPDEVKTFRTYQFAVSGSRLYLLGLDQDEKPTVVRFSLDGKYEGAIRLDQQIAPTAIAVLPTGQMFVLGTTRTDNTGAPTPPRIDSMLGLYGPSGALLKKVNLETRNLDLNNPKGVGAMPVELALLDADAGAAYLVFHTAEPTLYVISAGGEVQRTFRLWSPGKEFTPSQLRLSGGTEILLEFTDATVEGGGGEQFRYVSYNSFTGERTGYYYAAPGTTGTLGCYDWNGGFTFLKNLNGRRGIQYASAR